ncbi:hypothetical protein PTKIN_Ptkin11bG0166200 [Pterospermum kingtungense]
MDANTRVEAVTHMQTANVVWLLPPIGFSKLNVDAAFKVSSEKAVCGMVIRDYQGVVLLYASKDFSGFHSSLHAELMAICFGLELAHNEGFLVQLVESDSLLAVNEVKKGSSSNSEWLSLILDIDYFSVLCEVHKFSLFLELHTSLRIEL